MQFHGIELKPWAAKVAELVLWIGYLQWQVTAGRFQAMQEPLIQDLHHIECRDALITWKKAEAVVDEDGAPVLRAIGVSDKKAERRMVPVERLVGVKVAPMARGGLRGRQPALPSATSGSTTCSRPGTSRRSRRPTPRCPAPRTWSCGGGGAAPRSSALGSSSGSARVGDS
ncbi:MAG: hypothetical protein IPF99_09335 [Deltaproteobacteria bacterium]|nr:hypothetical protein [Deltaproteobacteria bacterium]